MTHGSLFSGIGGFDLAAEWMGWKNVFHCEVNDFCNKILHYYWPNSISYNDITKTDFTIHRGHIDVLTGGFPCQPYSTAGKRLGKEDERHLWPEMLRAIREIEPCWVVGENVLGLVSWSGGLVFEEVQADLEAEGYEVQPYVLPAAGVGAPHRRDRVWFVAKNTKCDGFLQRKPEKEKSIIWGQRDISPRGSNGVYIQKGTFASPDNKGGGNGSGEVHQTNGEIPERNNGSESCHSGDWIASDTFSNGQQGQGENFRFFRSKENKYRETDWSINDNERIWLPADWQKFPTVSPVCDGDDGIPNKLDGITISKWRAESIKGGGNAVVPQIPFAIFKAIQEFDNQTK